MRIDLSKFIPPPYTIIPLSPQHPFEPSEEDAKALWQSRQSGGSEYVISWCWRSWDVLAYRDEVNSV